MSDVVLNITKVSEVIARNKERKLKPIVLEIYGDGSINISDNGDSLRSRSSIGSQNNIGTINAFMEDYIERNIHVDRGSGFAKYEE